MEYVEPLALDFEVRGYDCGYGGPLKPFSLANFLQEAAGAHATRLGLGISDLLGRGLTWMLSRVDIRVDDSPREGERVSVATWPAGVERLFAMRDFLLRGEGGRVLARAVYAYLVVDVGARKPLRPQALFGGREIRGRDPHPVADYGFDLPVPGPSEISFAQRAWGRHIDLNGHVNNAYILEWLADAPPPESRSGMRLSSLRAEFKAEALAGDVLEASYSRIGDEGGKEAPGAAGPSFVSTLSRGGAAVARAATAWA